MARYVVLLNCRIGDFALVLGLATVILRQVVIRRTDEYYTVRAAKSAQDVCRVCEEERAACASCEADYKGELHEARF